MMILNVMQINNPNKKFTFFIFFFTINIFDLRGVVIDDDSPLANLSGTRIVGPQNHGLVFF